MNYDEYECRDPYEYECRDDDVGSGDDWKEWVSEEVADFVRYNSGFSLDDFWDDAPNWVRIGAESKTAFINECLYVLEMDAMFDREDHMVRRAEAGYPDA